MCVSPAGESEEIKEKHERGDSSRGLQDQLDIWYIADEWSLGDKRKHGDKQREKRIETHAEQDQIHTETSRKSCGHERSVRAVSKGRYGSHGVIKSNEASSAKVHCGRLGSHEVLIAVGAKEGITLVRWPREAAECTEDD